MEIEAAGTRQERKLFNYVNTIVILIAPNLMRIMGKNDCLGIMGLRRNTVTDL